jgi:hypothetical protein
LTTNFDDEFWQPILVGPPVGLPVGPPVGPPVGQPVGERGLSPSALSIFGGFYLSFKKSLQRGIKLVVSCRKQEAQSTFGDFLSASLPF